MFPLAGFIFFLNKGGDSKSPDWITQITIVDKIAAADLQELHRLGFLLDLNHSSNLTTPPSKEEAGFATATRKTHPRREHADYHLYSPAHSLSLSLSRPLSLPF